MNIDYKCQSSDNNESYEIETLDVNMENALKKIANKEGYVDYKISKKNITAEGGNCFGVLYEINIKGETAEGNKKETNIFVKHVIPKSDTVKLLSVSEIFNKEIFIYTELAEIFTKLQNNANIPSENQFKLVKIYGESNIDDIMLEDMTKQGFKTYKRLDVVELNYAKLCMENLAKLHGLAFVIEKNMPEYFYKKIKSLKQSLFIGPAYKAFACKIYEIATRKLSPNMKLKTDTWWQTALEHYSKYVIGTMTDVKCLCHGDFKINNIMYKETEGKITDVIAVDYQLAHYGSPVLDVIYFIFMGTDQKFRNKHLDYLKDHYHNSLQKFLKYFDMLVDDVYPRKIFEQDFEDSLDYGLVSCICVLPFTLCANDEAPEFIDNDIVPIGLKVDDTFYDRLKGIFEDFFKRDL